MPRLYTVEQANATLPYVSRIVADIVRSYGEWQEIVRSAGVIALGADGRADDAPPGSTPHRARLLAADIDGCVAELAALDIECKGLGEGLVDFPAVVDEAPAYLCWRLGESAVRWWHPRDTGVAGRRPVAGSTVLDPASVGADAAGER